ncbi:MAG: hypothetical protein U1E65_25310 [Myxococcota bacterium]
MTRLALFGLCLAALATPDASALSLVKSSSVSALSLDVGASLIVRYRATKVPTFDLTRNYELQRARVTFDLHYGKHLRLFVEPDFAGSDADLADTFLDLIPIPELTFRFGQGETPFGILETTSRLKMPSISRGMVSELMSDRTGFGGRRMGGMVKLKLKELPLKPELDAGIFGDLSSDFGADAAARLRLKPIKGLAIDLAWYHRLDATLERTHGNAFELGALYDREMWFVMIDAWLAYSRLFRKDNLPPTENAESFSVRALFSLRLDLDEDLVIEPYVGGSLMNPQLGAGHNLGLEVLGGLNLHFLRRFRAGIEGQLERGQERFSALDLSRLTAILAVDLQ